MRSPIALAIVSIALAWGCGNTDSGGGSSAESTGSVSSTGDGSGASAGTSSASGAVGGGSGSGSGGTTGSASTTSSDGTTGSGGTAGSGSAAGAGAAAGSTGAASGVGGMTAASGAGGSGAGSGAGGTASGGGRGASSGSCGDAMCAPSEVCVAYRVVGGTATQPDEDGNCPQGMHAEPAGSTVQYCVADFSYQCRELIGCEGAELSCACAAGACPTGYTACRDPQPDAPYLDSSAVLVCELLAP